MSETPARNAESVAGLEAEVSRLWGPTMFDWTLGRCRHDKAEVWFWMCGTAEKRRSWLHEGDAPTLVGALQAMIEAHHNDGQVPGEGGGS